MPILGTDHERIPHVVADIAQEAEGDRLQGLVGALLHGEKVGQDLGWMRFVLSFPHASM